VIEDGGGDTLQLAPNERWTWTLVQSDVGLTGIAGGSYDIWSFDPGTIDLIKLVVVPMSASRIPRTKITPMKIGVTT
jgi:hypothetical protein